MGLNVRIVRHGEMPLNRQENWDKVIKPMVDDPLTPRGVAEAQTLGKQLKDIQFGRAFSSDFVRARQTAEEILKENTHSKPGIIIEERVRERNSGEWEEKTPMDMYLEAKKLQMYPHFLPCPGGESVHEVMERAGAFFQELCKISDNTEVEENVLVTTHGAFLACFLEYLMSMNDLYELENIDMDLARKPAPTTGVTQIVIGEKKDTGPRVLKFIQLHDDSHLQGQTLPD